jgi:hypothetical protein
MNIKEHVLLLSKSSHISVSQLTYAGFSTEFKMKYHVYSFSGALPYADKLLSVQALVSEVNMQAISL